jgi:hypothetical protein
MTSRADLAKRIAALPDELLPEVERSIDDLEGWSRGVYRLNESEREAIRRALAAAERGDFASDEEIAALRASKNP